MGIPRNAAAYALPFACLFCGQCAKDPTDANRHCNDLVAEGPVFDYVYVSDPVPAATGSTIEDGIYYENQAEVFDPTHAGGPSGVQRSLTNVISGQSWQVAYRITDSSGTRTGTETYRISPAPASAGLGQLVMTRICPADQVATIPFGYSFSGSGPGATLQLILPGPPTTVFTSTRQ